MAILVRHRESGGRFAVLGANFTMWKSARGSAVFGDLFPVEEEGAARVLVMCDADGVIEFGHADDFVVEAIDGRSPQDLLGSS